jgi:hypothetical protein
MLNLQLIVAILLSIHITSGFASLFSAFGALASTKGASRHRRFGQWFFYGMTSVFFTAIPLSIITSNLFLFLIAIFSYYMAVTGWRYANNRSGVALKFDWVITIIMLIADDTMGHRTCITTHVAKNTNWF